MSRSYRVESTMSITRDDEELLVSVTAVAWPISRSLCAQIEDITARYQGKEVELTEREICFAEQDLIEDLETQEQALEDGAYDND